MLIKSNGTALRRPVLSPDGTTLAVIAPDDRVHLIDLSEAAQGRRYINGLKITKLARPWIRTCTILRWSPEVVSSPNDESLEVLSSTTSECELGKSWLLLSDGRRIVALSTELRSPKMMSTFDEEGAKSNILADYDLGDQAGKVSLLEFVFGHRHALVISEFSSTAGILSLTRPQRNDIPHVKFPDARSLAQAPCSRYFALLRRDKSQDKITVFHLGEDNQLSYRSFDCNTVDAQDITWCPTGQPLLAIRDSPAHGVKVSFFTAQGHALNQFDINRFAFERDRYLSTSNEAEGLGLTYWSWRKANRATNHLNLQVMANGEKQVLVRYQSANSMGTRPRASIVHPESVDGSKTFVWVEATKTTGEKSIEFARHTGAFEVLQSSPASNGKSQHKCDPQAQVQECNLVDIVELNSTHTLVAARLRASPRTLFLWRPHNAAQPHTVLVFRHAIRQIVFHPYLSHVLVVLTNSKHPRIYAWFQHSSPPIAGLIPIEASSSTNFVGSWLPECIDDSENRGSNGASNARSQRCPFLLTSNTAFEAGYLSCDEGRIVFESILHRPSQQLDDITLTAEGDESTTEIIDTPSRPSKAKLEEGGDAVVKKARFDVPEDSETSWKDDPVHEQARYAYAW